MNQTSDKAVEEGIYIGRVINQKQVHHRPTYSICTLVTNPHEYRSMCDSFLSHGFSNDDTEFLVADNTQGNTIDAFAAYNSFLNEAKCPYILLCHQDICLLEHGRERLDEIISELNHLDPSWGLFGNAGVTKDGVVAVRITDPHGSDRISGGPLPARVVTLDENFIVVRRSANLSVSHDLHGFHMYGTDLCLLADILGLSAYAVNFHLWHKSPGYQNEAFWRIKGEFEAKYAKAFRSRWLRVQTPARVVVSGSPFFRVAARVVGKVRVLRWVLRKFRVRQYG